MARSLLSAARLRLRLGLVAARGLGRVLVESTGSVLFSQRLPLPVR
jgi:hypothetical protein